ncbi:MAG: haloacid dehalogenase-like hydrolase, partial [Thermoguttaceae bacterium]|nr:haloacid dehalogenase-like hydrolase [Thermoguttaceae bacterium]
MRVAIFDIDGTLAHSTRADDRCFVRAVAEVFGISGFSTDWLAYQHQTDSGLCWELVRRHLGRDPTADECRQAEARLVALLAETVRADPDAIREVPGAVRLFRQLEDDPGWAVAVATGSWPASARFKLRRIGLDPDHVALASSGEAMDRC